MREIVLLRRTFVVQIILRGLVGASISFALIAFFALLTAPEEPALLASVPGLTELRDFVRTQRPWELFVAVFLIGALLDALVRVQTAALERYNLRRLLALTRAELLESSVDSDPRDALKLARTRLTGRRRLLEDLLRFDPAVITLAAVAVAVAVAGLAPTALVFGAWTLLVPALLPWIVRRMDARRDEIARRTPPSRTWSRAERLGDLTAFAEDRLADSARNSVEIINRPVDRLVVAWPVIALGTAAVVVASILSILGLAAEPDRALLLIVVIIVGTRSATRVVSAAEQMAFFASVLTHPVGERASVDEEQGDQ